MPLGLAKVGLSECAGLSTPVGELCPWLCREEWELVFSWLYSPGRQLPRLGLGRVAAWRARTEELPLGVDLTSDLLECRLNKGEGCRDLCLLHCMALSRFVNAVSDTARMQNTQIQHRTIASCAGSLGVPSWIVTLRHEGTHCHLPTLSAFQAAIEFALNWLKHNYWLPQMDTLGRQLKDSSEQQAETVWSEAVTPATQSQSATWKLTKGQFSNKSDLSKHLAQAEHDDLVQLLKKRQLLYFNPAVKYSVSQPVEAELAAFPVLNITNEELQQWRGKLLEIVQISSTFKQTLVVALIAAVHDNCAVEQRDYLASWLGPLLQESYDIETEEESGVEIISIDDTEQLLPGELNWKEVAAAASTYPGHYSYAIMAIVVKHLKSVKQAVKEKMLYLTTLVTLSERIGSANYIKGARLGELEAQADKAMAAITARCPPTPSKRNQLLSKRTELAGSSSDSNLPASKKARLDTSKERDCKKWTPVDNMSEWLHTPLGLYPGQAISPSMFDLPATIDTLSVSTLSRPSTPSPEKVELNAESSEQQQRQQQKGRFTSAELKHVKQCVELM